MARFLAVGFVWIFTFGPVHAQDTVWVQVEAQPTLGQAQTRVRDYAGQFENVNGYYLGSGWYGIALGPYARPDAEALLRSLKAQGAIPGDSFIATDNTLGQQFWPIGANAQTGTQPLPDESIVLTPIEPATTTEVTVAIEEPVAAESVVAEVPDETRSEAMASEELLTRSEKELLQTALQWAGFYDGAIDGAYGRGTRSSMAAWQEANGYERTGVLTTRQRSELLGSYDGVLEGLNLQLVRDDATGIEMQIPTGVVAFRAYEPPFARFDAIGDLPAQVLLISQEGDQGRLFGLYEILQTLEVVPTTGERTRTENSFTIEGANARFHTYVTANLEDGQIKGFALIWPANDEERRSRLLGLMQASFARTEGVLDPGISLPGEDQSVDLISGLEVRQPRLSRTGFFIDESGTVLTTSEVVDQCEYLTLDTTQHATVAHIDPALGIAALKPDQPMAPLGVVQFQSGVPRLQAEIAVSGYPYGGVLARPALTFGRLADIRGLNGEDSVKRLALVAQPGDAGGPVFDNGGTVLGMLLPKTVQNGQVLPQEVSFSVDVEAIAASLARAGISITTTDNMTFMPPETLTREAAKVTVLVSCW
ncbi:MAG: trypsin-like peptidase domain-containing protein [Rhodobacterales bacterium]|nr:trypsin-like peptidase domain-containing protein [Rhodobacterales bacterium]